MQGDHIFIIGYSASTEFKKNTYSFGHFALRFSKDLSHLEACKQLGMTDINDPDYYVDGSLDLRDINNLNMHHVKVDFVSSNTLTITAATTEE